MTKADIIDRIAKGTGLTKLETEVVVNGFITTVKDILRDGEHIEIRGFGTFKTTRRAPRVARNPRTNEQLKIPARYVPVFKPSKSFQEEVDEANQPSP